MARGTGFAILLAEVDVDLFYYGSQDVPLPLRGESPRRRSELGRVFCEACSGAVSHDDLLDGKAAEEFGLVLCERCRARSADVDLYFCDRCQVSVPVYRVDTGEALAGDGRILCLSCRETQQRRRRPLLVFASVALFLIVAGPVLNHLAPAPAIVRHVPAPPGPASLGAGFRDELTALLEPVSLDGLHGELIRANEAVAGKREWMAAILACAGESRSELDRMERIIGGDMDRLEKEMLGLCREIERLLEEPAPAR